MSAVRLILHETRARECKRARAKQQMNGKNDGEFKGRSTVEVT